MRIKFRINSDNSTTMIEDESENHYLKIEEDGDAKIVTLSIATPLYMPDPEAEFEEGE